jgi:hypothetical protein
MASRTTAVGTLSGSSNLTAAEYNDAAGGWVRIEPVTSNQGSITSLTDLTSLTTGAWTTPLRKMKFCFDLMFENTNVGENVQVVLLEDGTQIKRWNFQVGVATNADNSVAGSHPYSPTNASHTYKLQAGRSGTGSGTITLIASSTIPAMFWVEDLGPQ